MLRPPTIARPNQMPVARAAHIFRPRGLGSSEPTRPLLHPAAPRAGCGRLSRPCCVCTRALSVYIDMSDATVAVTAPKTRGAVHYTPVVVRHLSVLGARGASINLPPPPPPTSREVLKGSIACRW